MKRPWRLASTGVMLFALFAPRLGFAASEAAILRPGGGLIVADGRSIVPLVVDLRASAAHLEAFRARSSLGRVVSSEVISETRARLLLAMPSRPGRAELELELELAGGRLRTEFFHLDIPAPRNPAPPPLEPNLLTVGLDARDRPPALRTVPEAVVGVNLGSYEGQRWHLPADLPLRAPSHGQALAVITDDRGFAVSLAEVSVLARVSLRAQVPRGWQLVVTGAEQPVAPVPAPADGYTTANDVLVRYGGPLRVLRRRGRRTQELSVPVPSGRVPPGICVGLPGQLFADGGTGPSVAVAFPPGPFGQSLGPDRIEVEGARLVEVLETGSRTRVLVLERPVEAKTLRVLFDGVTIGEIELAAGRGAELRIREVERDADERVAAVVEVRDLAGQPTAAELRWRIDDGAWRAGRSGPDGRLRLEVPAGYAGARDAPVRLRAELPAWPVLAGDALDLRQAELQTRLGGLPPAIGAEESPEPEPAVPVERQLGLGLAADGFGGLGAGGRLGGGGRLEVHLPLPILDRRLGVASGIELSGALQNSGSAQLGTQSFAVPLLVDFALLRASDFSARLRAGTALRVDRGQLQVGRQTVGGSASTTADLRAELLGTLSAGPGQLRLGIGAAGLLTSLERFSGGQAELQGDGWELRVGVGYGVPLL